MGYGIHPRKDMYYIPLGDLMPQRGRPAHVVQRRSGPWTYYSGKTSARLFTYCAFCKTAQVKSNKGWMYRKHFNSGTPMTGPTTQHCCPKCVPANVSLADRRKADQRRRFP